MPGENSFINGTPLVVVEAKNPDLEDPLTRAITQLLRYSNQREEVSEPEGAERLFHYAQLMVATCFETARVGTVGASYEHYLEWKDTYPVPQTLGVSEDPKGLMVVYVARTYLLDHPEILSALATLGPVRALHRFLTALWRRLIGLAETVNERFPRRLSSRRASARLDKEPFHFFRLGALAPRERILYYYLSILRRAGRQGFPRRRSQTPHEYDAALGPHLPQAQQEMASLTQAFVEARYSLHLVNRKQEKQARTRWQQVKAALRALKRKNEQE
jgi:hypothetical protein